MVQVQKGRIEERPLRGGSEMTSQKSSYNPNQAKRSMSVVRCPLSVANLTLIEPKLDSQSVIITPDKSS